MLSRAEKTKEEKLLKKEVAVEVAVARQVDKVRLKTALKTEASKLRFDRKNKLAEQRLRAQEYARAEYAHKTVGGDPFHASVRYRCTHG